MILSSFQPSGGGFAVNIARFLGILFLGLGVVLFIIGVTSSHSLANSMSATFHGHLTQNTMRYIIGGIASAVIGLLLLLGAFGRKRS